MIIKKENMPQIPQILTDLKLPKVVSTVLIMEKKSVQQISENQCNLWQKVEALNQTISNYKFLKN
ncbi:MAG: hypothetical protein A2033_11020 [Bacteroidetes bacterium GWA2_31_9]|nr:MAG: hypothetical protein A2033_11020 [Bacteroidetes bacterium GWA2_31_9]